MSSDYWRKREEDWKNSNKKSEKEQQKQIQEIYMNTLDSITKEIESFFSRYSTSEGISMADAKKKVRKIDIEEYQRKAKKYVAEKNFSDTANAEMKLYNLTMKVNRLELLKANIGLELLDGTNNLETYFGETFNDEVMKELEHNASILGPSVLDNAKSAMVAVNSSFQNATWSERVWNNQAMLKNNLTNIISNALIQGKNAKDFIPEVRKQFNVSRYQAERLLRTELARARVQAQAESYAAEDIDEYEYVACGLTDCCSVCKKLDGKVFKLKKLEFGVNAPPMHPNCHCATAPYLDRKEFDEWLDGYSEHGLSYEDWKKRFVRYEYKDLQAIDDLLRTPTSQVWKKLSPSQKDSLFGYTGFGYQEVNSYLRGIQSNVSDMAKNDIKNITSALNKTSLPKNMILSRQVYYNNIENFLGVSTHDLMYNSIKQLKQKLEGTLKTEKGFTSTTATNNDMCSRDIKLEIEVPKEAKAMYMQPFTSYGNDDDYRWDGISDYQLGGETEVLIQKGARYKIKEVSQPYGNSKLLIKMKLEGFEDD